jgi:hypothetical protein
MTPQEKREVAVHVALKSIEDCMRRDPTAPALSDEEELVCRGKADNVHIAGSIEGIA